jgi:hypothetical protein
VTVIGVSMQEHPVLRTKDALATKEIHFEDIEGCALDDLVFDDDVVRCDPMSMSPNDYRLQGHKYCW